MRPIRYRILLLGALAGGCSASPSRAPVSYQPPTALAAAGIVPAQEWDSIAEPRTVGWTRPGLDSARARLAPLATTGFMAVVGGRVLMSYGDVQAVSYLASVRKSVLSLLMGNYVRRGVINLNTSLAQLGMDDIGGLTDQENEATVQDLLTARSGVYHPASNAGDDLASAPPRGSQKHGTYMLYSNWDFNALGGAFERITGRDIYADWVDESTRAFTPVGEMNPPRRREGPFGYGYLWWVWDGPHASGRYRGAYTGLGAVGQQITVIPALDLVVVHKTRPGQRDADGRSRSVSHGQFLDVLDLLVRSHCGERC